MATFLKMDWRTLVGLDSGFYKNLTQLAKDELDSLQELMPINHGETFINWILRARKEGLLDEEECEDYILLKREFK